MANMYIETGITSLVIREMKTKTSASYHFTTAGWPGIEDVGDAKCGCKCRAIRMPVHRWWRHNYSKNWQLLTKVNIPLLPGPLFRSEVFTQEKGKHTPTEIRA